ncbi:uncharacterized protein LOC109823880 isoform X2 [Asparagus officinalis]|uniref:uncharacterized protein LOC109823880 isoform X2 n=1 Tax=Asparagus officinalis TaxID=4686 RepID=UPI00098E240E|nr:uncharacterized protein LOC109823880 isoform X2 [Asparagus officinalis]
MAEPLTLTSPAEASETVSMDLKTFRSRLKDLQESRSAPLDSSETSNHDPKNLIQELISDLQGRIKQIELEEENVASLGPDDLEEFLEQLKKEVDSTEEENMKISNEINDLTRTFSEDLNLLDGELESMAFWLNLIDSQGLDVRLYSGDEMDILKDNQYEILKLQQDIDRHQNNLSILQDLDFVFKRMEAIGQIEDKLSQVKVLEFEDNCIRLSLKTPIPSSESLLLRHKLDYQVEPSTVEHELLIEVVEKTLEVHKVEIFPNDVPLNDIVYTIKSSSNMPIARNCSALEYLVRHVQHRILICTLRRLLLKDAKISRHSFEYSDRDETITAHLVGGIDAFIKVTQSWPISDSGLKLVSIKNSNSQSKSISLSFLYKVKELTNSLNIQTRGHLVRFLDAIEEILVREMHSELHSNDISA